MYWVALAAGVASEGPSDATRVFDEADVVYLCTKTHREIVRLQAMHTSSQGGMRGATTRTTLLAKLLWCPARPRWEYKVMSRWLRSEPVECARRKARQELPNAVRLGPARVMGGHGPACSRQTLVHICPSSYSSIHAAPRTCLSPPTNSQFIKMPCQHLLFLTNLPSHRTATYHRSSPSTSLIVCRITRRVSYS